MSSNQSYQHPNTFVKDLFLILCNVSLLRALWHFVLWFVCGCTSTSHPSIEGAATNAATKCCYRRKLLVQYKFQGCFLCGPLSALYSPAPHCSMERIGENKSWNAIRFSSPTLSRVCDRALKLVMFEYRVCAGVLDIVAVFSPCGLVMICHDQSTFLFH